MKLTTKNEALPSDGLVVQFSVLMEIRERLDFLTAKFNLFKQKTNHRNKCIETFKQKIKSKLDDDTFSAVEQHIQSIPSKYDLIYVFVYNNLTFPLFNFRCFNETNFKKREEGVHNSGKIPKSFKTVYCHTALQISSSIQICSRNIFQRPAPRQNHSSLV